MKRVWNDQEITKVLRQLTKAVPERTVFDRIWFNIEERLASRKKHLWKHIIWKPFSHPASWVAAACLCLAFTGTLYRQITINNNEEMAAYMMSVSTSTSNMPRDLGMVNVSVLLSGPSTSAVDFNKTDDEHSDILAGDDILL